MKTKTIQITEVDLNKLRDSIQEAKLGAYRSSPYIQQLIGELERARIVKGKEVPPDVITMNSKVLLTNITSGEQMELTLVFPEESGKDETAVSVLAPIGTAMIGYRAGDTFEWETPDGKVLLRVDKIIYQPESSGIFD